MSDDAAPSVARMQTPKRELLAFLMLTGVWSWGLWLPRALTSQGITAVPVLPNLGAFGPTIAALVLTYHATGRPGVKRLLRRTVDARFRARWWLAILLLFPSMNAGLLLGSVLLGAPLPAMPWRDQPLTLAVGFIIVLVSTGPIQEELGWRGYALDRLQAIGRRTRWPALLASFTLGGIWAAWHLPLFFFETAAIYRSENVIGFLPAIVLVTIIMTWIHNNTGGSLLAAVLTHASFNFSHWAFPVLESPVAREVYLIVLAGTTAIVVTGWGPRRLRRGSDLGTG